MGNIEQFVKKDKTPITKLLVILYYVAAVVLIILLYKFVGNGAFIPAPFLLIAAVLVSKYTLMMSRVEYEYTFSTGILNIDKIFSQTKRVPVVNIAVSEFTNFGTVSDSEAERLAKQVKKVYFCASSDESETAKYFTCAYQSRGDFMFVFEPNEQLLKAMAAYSHAVSRNINK